MCKRMLFFERIKDMLKRFTHYFSKGEWALWAGSMALITVSFFAFGQSGYLTLSASLIGVTSLIFAAKGNPVGPLLMIIFGMIYGYISFGFAYYGEMITYVGMTVPMSAVALAEWLRNPYNGSRAQVKVNRISVRETLFMLLLTAVVTAVFWYILKAIGIANLLPSTVSVATSFAAAYLTFRRSPFYALVYAMNDIVLIVLWVMASFSDISYVAVVICFAVFFVNDLYGFISWSRMRKKQHR